MDKSTLLPCERFIEQLDLAIGLLAGDRAGKCGIREIQLGREMVHVIQNGPGCKQQEGPQHKNKHNQNYPQLPV